MWLKTKEFLKLHETKIILTAGFILVAVLSFEAGIMKGQTIKQNPIIVKENTGQAVCGASSGQSPEAQNLPSEGTDSSDGINTPQANCAYLGSKNSNKYHLPNCQYAKRIKQGNIVCFTSENEAKLKGYLPDKGCIK